VAKAEKLRRFSKNELWGFNGEERKPVYIAFKGKVYDVSRSPLWSKGKHQSRHNASHDLTETILNAPHSEAVLSRFRVVGELAGEEKTQLRLASRLQNCIFTL
jgi:predicted heme/steroid binding protein